MKYRNSKEEDEKDDDDEYDKDSKQEKIVSFDDDDDDDDDDDKTDESVDEEEEELVKLSKAPMVGFDPLAASGRRVVPGGQAVTAFSCEPEMARMTPMKRVRDEII